MCCNKGQGTREKVTRLFSPRYKTVRAVDGIDLCIKRGEIIGWLGPNGAGKSTTIKLLTGVLHPDGGALKVNNLIPSKRRVENARQIGVVYGQRSQLWWDLPLIDSFEILKAMYRIPPAQYRANLDFMIELLNMQSFLEQPVRKLSLGQRMKGDIVASLLHEPPILYLDEPTIGLDVVSKNAILNFIGALNANRHTTVLLTTHNLSDVEHLCKRILIIDHGKIILDVLPDDLIQRYGKQRQLIVEFSRAPDGFVLPITINKAVIARREGNKVVIVFNRDDLSALQLIASLSEAALPTGVNIVDVSIKDDNVESVITRIYEDREGKGTARQEKQAR